MNDSEHFISPREAAETLGVSIDTVRRRIRDGSLPAVKFGAAKNSPVRIDPNDIAEALRAPAQQVKA